MTINIERTRAVKFTTADGRTEYRKLPVSAFVFPRGRLGSAMTKFSPAGAPLTEAEMRQEIERLKAETAAATERARIATEQADKVRELIDLAEERNRAAQTAKDKEAEAQKIVEIAREKAHTALFTPDELRREARETGCSVAQAFDRLFAASRPLPKTF